MAPRVLLAAAACAAALAGCSSGASEGALDNALGYLPSDAPFVVAIATDPEGDQVEAIRKIAERFPFSNQLTQGLEESLAQEDVDFEEEVKPLLGNELVIGGVDVTFANGTVSTGGDRFVAALEVKDEDKLEELLSRQGVEQIGKSNGATIYEGPNGGPIAVRDSTAIAAPTREQLEAALERKDGDDHLDAEAFDEDMEDLPGDALIRVAVDVEQLLEADPGTARARRVKWVSALRTLGLTVSFEEDRASIEFRLGTESEGLSEADLPIPAGSDSPDVIDSPGEIGLGLRDPEQILAFAEDAGQVVDPEGFREYGTGRAALEARLDLDIDQDLLGRLEGDVSAAVSPDGRFGLRAVAAEPERLTRALDKLGKALPDLLESAVGEPLGYAAPKAGEDFYALGTTRGDSVVYGVVDGIFVLANDTRRASRLPQAETVAVDGAEGSVAVRADAQQLAQQAIGQASGGVGGALGGALVAGPLDELTASMAAETDGLSGRLELTFD